MLIGEKQNNNREKENHIVGPSGYPEFPMPGLEGKTDRNKIFEFMPMVRNKIAERIANKEFGLVQDTWIVPIDKIEGRESSAVEAMIIAMGLVESDSGGFPYTPLIWMLPLQNETSIGTWGQYSENERNSKFEELLRTRLTRHEDESKRTGGIGKLRVKIHGWGGNPFYPWRYMRHMGEKIKSDGGDVQQTIVLSMGTQGALGTSEVADMPKLLDMIPDQIQGTLNKVVDHLIEGMGGEPTAKEELKYEERFWDRLEWMVGHSMGAYAVIRWRLKYAKELSAKNLSKILKILALDMVTIGTHAPWEEHVRAKQYMDITPYEPNVTLLEAPIRGFLVSNIDRVLSVPKIDVIAKNSMIVNDMVRTYMGSGRSWETLLHEETVLNDRQMIMNNNYMLDHASSLVQSMGELCKIQEWVNGGSLLFGAGSIDGILKPMPILKAINKFGGKVATDTVNHYPNMDLWLDLYKHNQFQQ